MKSRISIWRSFKTMLTLASDAPCLSYEIAPKITPVSVELTLIVAVRLWKPCGPSVCGVGLSTSLRSPRHAISTVRFCNVSVVWLTIKRSTKSA